MAYGNPRLGIELELQLPAYITAAATRDPSRACDLHHSSQQRQIPNPLSEARDRTRNLMVPSQIRFCCTMTGTLLSPFKGGNWALLKVSGLECVCVCVCVCVLNPAFIELKVLGGLMGGLRVQERREGLGGKPQFRADPCPRSCQHPAE